MEKLGSSFSFFLRIRVLCGFFMIDGDIEVDQLSYEFQKRTGYEFQFSHDAVAKKINS